MGIEVTAKECRATKNERVRDASGSDGGLANVVDYGPFPTGGPDLDSEVSFGKSLVS